MNAIRMTASLAERLFAESAPLLSGRQLTAQRLDMLHMSDVDIWTRAAICEADDAIKAGDYGHAAVAKCVKEFNARCGK